MWGGVGEGEVALWWRRGEWWGVVERGRGKGRETQVVPPLFCSVEETRKIPDTLLGHYDKDLKPWQHTIILAVLPSLLLNTPRPWPVFVFIVVFHLLMLVGVTWWVYTHCPRSPSNTMELLTYRTWNQVTGGDTEIREADFGCLRYTGDFRTSDVEYICGF